MALVHWGPWYTGSILQKKVKFGPGQTNRDIELGSSCICPGSFAEICLWQKRPWHGLSTTMALRLPRLPLPNLFSLAVLLLLGLLYVAPFADLDNGILIRLGE